MRRYIAVVAAFAVFSALLAGCRSENNPPAVTDNPVQTEETQQTEAMEGMGATEGTEVPEATDAPGQAGSGGVLIATKYGNLYYQDQWEDFMRIELTEKETYVIVAFAAEVDGVKYPLFHVIVGESDGDPVGQITDAQGAKHDVFVYMEEISGTSDLTEGEQNRLFAMQEEINYVIENLE